MSNTSNPPLSVVTAILNEEKLLPSFLAHIENFTDEIIIVVDSRTVDNSADIAEKHGCKVLLDKGESKGIVFNNKNWGANEAKNDWVLILDADERMDETLQKEIISIVSGTYPKKADIYQTGFLNYEFGKIFDKSDQKNKPFVRLFRKGSFSYQTARTAEGFGIQSNSLQSPNRLSRLVLKVPLLRTWYLNKMKGIVTLRGHLVHLSHPTISDFVRKIDHYSTREAKILFEKDPSISKPILVLKMIFLPKKEFLYKYFVWKFYKEGTHGFIVSIVYTFYHFLIYSKYFSLIYTDKHRKETESLLKKYGFTEQE
ncbi:MAG: glycosyl transferase family protein [uncultured bacterium]|nr:MAG: glycosyl transferase family protein [uncultured bacterium]